MRDLVTKAERRKRWTSMAVFVLGLLLAGIALAYPLADMLRAPLDDAARAELIRTGKADHFVHLSLGTMHVRETGAANGPVVLLVHGSVVGGYAWRQWEAPLATAGYRVIAPDLLGYGFSDRPQISYTRNFYTHQLAELLDALKIKQPVRLVGASMGGAFVTAFAADMPSRVQSITLIAPAGVGRNSHINEALLLPVIGDWVFRVFGPRQLTGMMEKAYPPSAERDALVGWMKDQGRFRCFAEGVLNTLRHYDTAWQPDDYQTLGRSGIPVLTLWGTADTVNPYVQSRQLAAWLPQVKLVSLQHKPHAITFGDAPLLLSHILPFWAQLGDAPPAGR
jgi:pimeloyl-ACP methyl ester carboxylesterase